MDEAERKEAITERREERDKLARSLAHSNISNQEFHDALERHDNEEYRRGIEDTQRAQEAGPAGSEEREAAYLEMEQRWHDEGFDG